MSLTCCGWIMYWERAVRDRTGRTADQYRCGMCGAAKLLVQPPVSPRYLEVRP